MERVMTKVEAHVLVWSKPIRELAREWRISEPALRRLCFRAGIPLPSRGHWNKIHAGKPSPVIPLPPRGIGESDRVYFGTLRQPYGTTIKERREDEEREQRDGIIIPPLPSFDESLDELRVRVTTMIRTISAHPAQTHPLAEAMLDALTTRLEAGSEYWGRTDPTNEQTEKRRIRLLNAVFMGLKREGYTCERSQLWSEDGPTFFAVIGDTRVEFSLRMLVPKRRGSATSTPRLRFELSSRGRSGAPRLWDDPRDDPLDRHLTEIVIATIVAGEEHHRAWEQERHEFLVHYAAERQARREREAEAAAAAAREREHKEQEARLAELEAQASDFRRAKDIRAYVEEIRAYATRQNVRPATIEAWASWALAQADQIDPVLSRRLGIGQST